MNLEERLTSLEGRVLALEEKKPRSVDNEKNNASFQAVFDCWNKQSDNGRWKTHRKLTPDIENAVRKTLKDKWTAEDVCSAIKNFAAVLQSPKGTYKWTYDRWGLAEFLTRGQKDDKGLRWTWFHTNNFKEDDWLTDATRKKRIEQARAKEYSDSEPVEQADLTGIANTFREMVKKKREALK